MAYTIDRSEQYPVERPPIALRLLGEWKRSVSAQARVLATAGPVARTDLHELATVWLHLDGCERELRFARALPKPGSTPEWVLDNAL